MNKFSRFQFKTFQLKPEQILSELSEVLLKKKKLQKLQLQLINLFKSLYLIAYKQFVWIAFLDSLLPFCFTASHVCTDPCLLLIFRGDNCSTISLFYSSRSLSLGSAIQPDLASWKHSGGHFSFSAQGCLFQEIQHLVK